jgi:ribosomal protein S18 acetylase RimI-like enzyme
MSESFHLRGATPDDRDFIADMVVLAVNWKAGRDLPREGVLQTPGLAHYVSGWKQPTDLGVIATTRDGNPVGAAWLRLLSADDPGYGYIADDVPELAMAVLSGWRRRGVGRALIRAVLADAQSRGVRAVSLSVEQANPAAHLYADEGFGVVQSSDDADTMLLTLT